MNLDARLRNIFSAVFDVDASTLTDDDSPKTIEGWDSVKHIQLVMALEAEFPIQFEPDDIAGLTRFGAIRKRLETQK